MPNFFLIYDRVCLIEAGEPYRFWQFWEKAHNKAIRTIVNAALEEAAQAAEKDRDRPAEAIRGLKFWPQ